MEEKQNQQQQEMQQNETVQTTSQQKENVEITEETTQQAQQQTESVEGEVVDETQQKIAKLEQQCADYLDKYQRCLAEFDNFRKRTAKEKAGMYDDGIRSSIEKLLPVIDNLERAVAAHKQTDEEDSFYKGVQMTLKQFQEILTSLGVEEIKAVGEVFNPNLHAAVAHEENEEYAENTVMAEMLKGYKYKDKVIRHSMVKVAN
ncbi:MAG TPA: nucleotide exchange factor GrpE [Candidatus Coprocola pullicola]|nr:nucleotide exchange factor GrpE [Candidatus Coprocola pullicola]